MALKSSSPIFVVWEEFAVPKKGLLLAKYKDQNNQPIERTKNRPVRKKYHMQQHQTSIADQALRLYLVNLGTDQK